MINNRFFSVCECFHPIFVGGARKKINFETFLKPF